MLDRIKNKSFLIIIISIIITILLSLFIYKTINFPKNISNTNDIKEDLVINNSKLNIKYLKGNMIDEHIEYGNVLSKIIEINNKTDEHLSYAIVLNESVISNDYLSYRIYESDTLDNNSFNIVTKDTFLQENASLGYNFYIKSQSKKYIKIEFKSNYENDNTTFKGVLKVVANLTDKDIFINNANRLISELNKKINELNGINNPGIYILNISELKVPDYYGYILIDARDISDLKYYLTIYNNSLMVENLNIRNIKKKNIIELNSDVTNKFKEDYVCKLFSKKECKSFHDITYHENGGRTNFYQESNKVIDFIKNNFDKKNKEVYIYDLSEDLSIDTNIEGFILIDNTLENEEYYLYIHNNLFMISGYNLTKLGEFKSDSATIRAYNETAFELTNNKYKVCKFSGFDKCLDINDNEIK